MLFLVAVVLSSVAVVGYLIYQRHFHPLCSYPGPLFGSVTNFWRFYHELKGDLPTVINQYHRQHGPIIRVSPTELNINTADIVEVVYKKGGRHYPKTEFYNGFTAILPNVFGTRNEAHHSLRRRQMAHAFSMSSLVKMEYIFDRHVKNLLDRLSTYSSKGAQFELKDLLKFYSQDANGDLSLGIQFDTQLAGDPERIPLLNDHIALAKLTGYVPWLKPLFDAYGKHIPWPYLQQLISSRAGMRAQAEEVTNLEFDRIGRTDASEEKQDHVSEYSEDEEAAAGRWNLFTGLARARDPDTGEPIPREEVTSNALTFLTAGSHSTAATLEVVFWYLLHYPNVMARCQKEISAVVGSDDGFLPHAGMEAKLPYMSAVMQECFRLSPVFQHPSPRYTPADPSNPRFPAYLPESDITLPPNTAVSVSVYSLHRNPDVWGDDAEKFRPERWLEEGAKNKEGLLFQFGAGHRACIGRNQSLIMIWKCVFETLRRYDFRLMRKEGCTTEREGKQKEPHMRVTGFAEIEEDLLVTVAKRTPCV